MNRQVSYTFRNNPHNTNQSFVTYDQLTSQEAVLDSSSVYLTVMPKVDFHMLMPMSFGLGFRFHYYLETHEIEFRTSPQKLTPYFVPTGYESFEMELVPRLEAYMGSFYFYLEFANRMMPETDFSFDPQLGLGLQF